MSYISHQFTHGMRQGAIHCKAEGVMLASLKQSVKRDTNLRLEGAEQFHTSDPSFPRLRVACAGVETAAQYPMKSSVALGAEIAKTWFCCTISR